MSKPLLIAFVGLPRSGKSTICRKLSEELHAPIVRRDDIRLALHGQRFHYLAEPMVRAISGIMIRSLFLSGHEVVICDETHYSRAARDFNKSPQWDTVFYEVTTSPEVCKERAVLTGQHDLIPVIDEMFGRRDPLGDDEIRYIPTSGEPTLDALDRELIALMRKEWNRVAKLLPLEGDAWKRITIRVGKRVGLTVQRIREEWEDKNRVLLDGLYFKGTSVVIDGTLPDLDFIIEAPPPPTHIMFTP